MNRCDQIHEWLEQTLEDQTALPSEVQRHLETCPSCRHYQAELNQTLILLNHLEIPAPPVGIVDDVMQFIQQKEIERELNQFFFPGWALLKSIQKTWKRYFPTVRIPLVLQREAWPTAIATIFIVFGVFLSPLSEPGQSQKFLNNPVVLEVNSMAAKLRATSDNFIEQVAALRADLLGESSTAGFGGTTSYGTEAIQMLK